PAAARDIAEADAWYRTRNPDVAVAFRDTLAAHLTRIERSPTAFPVVQRDVRRCLLGRFPYALYFRLLPDELRVIACTHLRRHARRWQRRR
ncbi:MAG TPA: type II toxin-antitoxin system RelE/ParE family toxin, partial [Gemmatimonadales bacterium]|nr:type II toxin-antitoxin system RelE/ParE family toxin [Gemmatimonadales bacterium]